MTLPSWNALGDLPPGVYQATLAEVIERFGGGTEERRTVTARLERIYGLARATGGLERLVLFGSYVTAKRAPNDVDVILVMRDDFVLADCPAEARSLFDHRTAHEKFGASVFWVRPALLIQEDLETFLGPWQLKRDGTRRGIVEGVA